ncbi:DNA phosphorothioation system sulfurtransferase DndC [Paenibacillus roseipurpureus]|uniref:DNA phosphorothioation system sulfurtransferase DndC n=1 Tax=Paenibacillus roseopurpureus TaxID=2918901 RepID=A0AA96LPY3_9BACL|nr:DNA phosphorothioation system sulfurtransferase DndC [Paenibacillus sp. MBLB1832]WNR45136.1 DNA phosphorothioation system sulfurtransferase DndC [Paenibacillus sp. MBLB1832]
MNYKWKQDLWRGIELVLNIFAGNTKFEVSKALVKETYLSDERPWVVGFSGGKDSTALVQIIFTALSELSTEQLTKKVYVISSDTLVETPLIINKISQTLGRIQDRALELGLPIEAHKVKPAPESTFWTSIIGKGYPTPRQTFRWCTDRLKIEPANRFILDKVSKFGEVNMVLGVRDSESSTRAGVMQAHTIEGKVLMRHSTLTNAFVFAPIRSFDTDDVWEYLLQVESPWGDDNNELLKLYQDSNSECPLVVDKDIKESAGSCGNSRFGCWTCTVVSEDKALSGFINNGVEWLRPLYDFRKFLVDIRADRNARQKHRMNGQVYLTTNLEGINVETSTKVPIKDLGNYLNQHQIDLANVEELNLIIIDHDGEFKQLGLGPFTLKAREEILRKLLQTQNKVRELHDPTVELISLDELKVIRQFWEDDLDWEDRIPKIYEEETGEQLVWDLNDRPTFAEDQITDLERLCNEEQVNIAVLKKLIAVEKDYSGFKVRRGLLQDFEKALRQDFLHL